MWDERSFIWFYYNNYWKTEMFSVLLIQWSSAAEQLEIGELWRKSSIYPVILDSADRTDNLELRLNWTVWDNVRKQSVHVKRTGCIPKRYTRTSNSFFGHVLLISWAVTDDSLITLSALSWCSVTASEITETLEMFLIAR